MSQKVNLNAYFERIGFAGSIAPTLATLEQLLALHPAAIPFENLNPLLGLPVNLDLASIERKLLTERRGGYCFEHNTLLQAVLRELDFSVRSVAARVIRGNPAASGLPPTHMLLLVEIGGIGYIADAGFGSSTPTGPLKLRPDVEQTTPHGTYRLTGGAPEWTLETRIGDEWQQLYVFAPAEVAAAEHEAANTIVSTSPDSAFTTELRVALSPPGRRLALRDNRFNIHVAGEESVTEVLTSVAELRELLSGTFGIALPPAELLDSRLEAIIASSSGA